MSFSDILSRILGIGYLRNNPDGCVTQTRRYEHTDTKLDLVHHNTYFESNKVGRFLILKDETKMEGKDIMTEESSDVPKSEMNMKESTWKYFAAIIDWLSFFCVILTYVIILITLIPAG